MRGIQALPKDATYGVMDSPVSKLTIITSPQGLHAIFWDTDCDHKHYAPMMSALRQDERESTIVNTKQQLSEYFQGKRKIFDLPLVLNGTDFQKQAWHQLLQIPYGKTISYGEQASRVGNKNKARAVGMANGQNPISIVIPCHRVIGSNGHLTGFGGGLDKKACLLQLEQRK